MAIGSIQYRDDDNLAYAQKSFYPVRIPVSHWQLRHYISTPEADLLYYASGHDIYCLNTTTKKRKHVATLPFEARCTASGYGWVCVGGEDEGHFAAIKLDGSNPRPPQEVDAALPVEPWRTSTATEGRRAASVKVERIGDEIVNSISIHRIQDEEAHLDDIVAVLTNNDKTVRMYSLPQAVESTVLDLPFAMNHATISPDGSTLVAVGDYNQAYFFQRELTEDPPQIPKPHNRLNSSSLEWNLRSVVTLHSSDTTSGYFTTAWSPSSQMIAVGSEGGYITVFDMELLMDSDVDDESAIVAVVPGSRPEQQSFPGAIRAMTFSPDPWDLLIWAEDQGRICIGDLRTGLKTKQVLTLEPKDEGLEKMVFEDVAVDNLPAANMQGSRDIDDLEADFLRRYRQAPDNATAVNFATEYIEARRRQRQQRQDMAALRSVANSAGVNALEDDPQGLTVHEQQILETLRTGRQREEARAHGQHARTVNYTTPDMFRTGPDGVTRAVNQHAREPTTARPISEVLSAVPDSFPELARTSGSRASAPSNADSADMLPSLDEIQDVASSRQRSSGSWLSRTIEGSRLPRRRASVLLSPSSVGLPNPTSAPSSAQPSRLPQSTSHPTETEETEDNPWRTIEEHMTLARGPLFEGAARADASSPIPAHARPTEQELAAELAAERARARSLARQRDRIRTAGRSNPAPTDGVHNATSSASHTSSAATTSQDVRRLTGFPEGYEALLRRSQMRGMGMGGMGLGMLNAAAAASGRENCGVRTAGLAMSVDGRYLWAACEEGIFEVRVNVKGRMFWPAVEMR